MSLIKRVANKVKSGDWAFNYLWEKHEKQRYLAKLIRCPVFAPVHIHDVADRRECIERNSKRQYHFVHRVANIYMEKSQQIREHTANKFRIFQIHKHSNVDQNHTYAHAFFLPAYDCLILFFVLPRQGLLRHGIAIVYLVQQQTAYVYRQRSCQNKHNVFARIDKVEYITEYQQYFPPMLKRYNVVYQK